MTSLCFGCMRTTVFLANFVFWLIGAIIVGLAFYLRLDTDLQSQFVNSGLSRTLTGIVYLLTGIGIFTAVLSFLGCCGAYHRSQMMLFTFFSVTFLLFCIEIIVGAWIYSQKDNIAGEFDISMDRVVKKHYPQRIIHSNILDTMQRRLKCCGWYSPSDYLQNRFIQTRTMPKVVYPDSCCLQERPKCGQNVRPDYEIYSYESQLTEHSDVYSQGCRVSLRKALSKHVIHFVGFISLITFTQAFAILMTVYLCCTIRKSTKFYNTRAKCAKHKK